jgi:hypothetical protein
MGGQIEDRFTSFGVTVAVTCPEDLADALEAALPPGREPSQEDPSEHFFITQDAEGFLHLVTSGGGVLMYHYEPALVLDALDSAVRAHVAGYAPEHVFVHAGVVSWNASALVLPGQSFAGKSTLVAALIAEGATYYSDEYAVLDDQGRVHPYARGLSLRLQGPFDRSDTPLSALGTVPGTAPVPIRLIAATEYRPGSRWNPSPLSRGVGVLRLLDNTVTARANPDRALRVLRLAASTAAVLEGERGEAADAARDLKTRFARLVDES